MQCFLHQKAIFRERMVVFPGAYCAEFRCALSFHQKAAFVVSRNGLDRTSGITELSGGSILSHFDDGAFRGSDNEFMPAKCPVHFLCEQPCSSSAAIVSGNSSGISFLRLPLESSDHCTSLGCDHSRVLCDFSFSGSPNAFALHPTRSDLLICALSSGGIAVINGE